MHRPGSGPEAPSPWAQPGQAVWAPPSSPPWGVHAILPPTCLSGLLDSPCTYCLCVWASQLAPLGTRLTAEGRGGPSTSHTFSPHIASGPYKVDMHLMVRAPNMVLTSHPSVSLIQMRVSALRSAKLQPYSCPPKKLSLRLTITGDTQGVGGTAGGSRLANAAASPPSKGLPLLPDCDGGNCVKEEVLSRLTGGQ